MAAVQKVPVVILAGGFGGLVNSLALWFFGMLGVTPALGFQMTPALTPGWLLPRLIPSAIWGLLFLIPFLKDAPFRKGLILSIPLWLMMLLVVFPKKMGAGLFGLKLGMGAPLWTLFFTLLWGLGAAMIVNMHTKK